MWTYRRFYERLNENTQLKQRLIYKIISGWGIIFYFHHWGKKVLKVSRYQQVSYEGEGNTFINV